MCASARGALHADILDHLREAGRARSEGRAAEHNIPLSDFLREQALSGTILVRRARNIEAILNELRNLLRRIDAPEQASDELGEG
jgi:hypothetical protein